MRRVRVGSLLALLVCVGAGAQELETLNEEQLRKRIAVHLDHKQVEQALAAADQWSVVAPREPEAWALRGRLRTALGQLEGAEADLSRLVAMDPGRAQAWADRAAVRLRRERHAGALEDADHAVSLDPGLALGWFVRGLARQAQGQHEAAIVDFQRAVDASPPYPKARFALGASRRALGQAEAADADRDAALALDAQAGSPWGRPPARADGHPDLSHVRVGQRYHYAMPNNMSAVWTVLEVGQDSLRYTTTMRMDFGNGPQAVGEPTEQRWEWQPGQGAAPGEAKLVRETVTVSGVAFDCLVVTQQAGGVTSKSWVSMTPGSDEVPTFPGPIKVLNDGQPVMVLTRVEQPPGGAKPR